MPIYETVYILHPELPEARRKEVIEAMQNNLGTGQANLLQVEEWGMRNLAFDIQKQKRGYYVRFEYESPPEAVKEFERGLRLSEDVMRFLSVARAAPSDGRSPIPPGSPGSRAPERPTESRSNEVQPDPPAEAAGGATSDSPNVSDSVEPETAASTSPEQPKTEEQPATESKEQGENMTDPTAKEEQD